MIQLKIPIEIIVEELIFDIERIHKEISQGHYRNTHFLDKLNELLEIAC